MERRERGSVGKVFGIFLTVVIILGLGATVVYLLSERNHHQYRLAVVDNKLEVQRGRLLPFGFEPFVPKAEALKRAYEPIPIPEGQSIGEPEIYDDRTDIDRTLFSLLAGWARLGLEADDLEAMKRATGYIERSELLPGLSEEQRLELRTLRADLAYQNGKRLMAEVGHLLQRAREEFELAIRLGTSRPTDARDWITDIAQRMLELSDLHLRRPERNDERAPLAPLPAPGADDSGKSGPSSEDSGEQSKDKKWRL